MSIVTVGVLGTRTISTSETDSVSFQGVGTLDIAGVPGAPINVTLSQVGGVGLLDTVNITYANVTLNGVAGVSALAAYNIGAGGELIFGSTANVAVGTTITFTAPDSRLVLSSGINLSLLGGISGFGVGSSIDVAPRATQLTYVDANGSNTGGVITLEDASGTPVDTITLNTGDFTANSFRLSPDGNGGTIIGFTGVTGVTAAPSTADLGIGHSVAFTVTTNDNVTVAGGLPTLTLSDGGTATYNALASTPTSLVFNYTVATGQNSPDLAVTGFALNGATITDSIGNPFDLTPAEVNPAGTLQIDGTPPVLTLASATPANGDLGAGQVVTFILAASEAVTVSGATPSLTLSDGGTATYDAASSTATSLVFRYTVLAGQTSPDLTVTAANLNGATITDAAGNTADLTAATGNPAGTLQIDTTAPTITGVTANPASGTLGIGQTLTFLVATSEPVTVTGGTPTLTLTDGATATYNAGASTSTSLAFTDTVAPGDTASTVGITADALNGATIADGAGNALDLNAVVGTTPVPVQIDGTPPSLTLASASPATADLGVGQTVTFTVAASEAVTVAGGTPSLTLSDGGTATYNAAASTSTSLAFSYTVAAGQNSPDLTVTAANLNGATIRDAAGNSGSLATATGNPAGILQVDTTAPTITNVTANPASGTLGIGQTLTFLVATSEPVSVTGGVPTLTLSDGATATYNAAASTATSLAFTDTVAPGDNASSVGITADALNGAIIADGAGNALNLNAVLTAPPIPIHIDGTAPTLALASASPATGDLGVGQTVTFTVAASKPVTISGGPPTLTLSDGGTATYNAAASTATSLVFSYTVAAGQNSPDLAVTTGNLNGATIADSDGNTADLSAATGNPAGILQVDTTAPTITSVSANPPSGTLGIGQTLTFLVATSEPVSVTGGVPTLTLSDGATATYDAAASTATSLAFTDTVAPGDTASSVGITSDALNGAIIADGAGNALDLNAVLGATPVPVQIDGTPPTLTLASASPPNADLGAGQTVTFTLAASEPVTVSGATPTLTLSDGGTATYDPAASTTTSLAFTYTVALGENSPDLTVTAANLNGATITDAAGNTADLTAATGDPAGTLQIDTTAPTITSVTASPASGTLGIGQTLTFLVATSEAVSVTGGTPSLTLSDGATATYIAGASTSTSLVFTDTVAPGDTASSVGITADALNGATIADGAGNALDLSAVLTTTPVPVQIDGTAPTLALAVASPANADLGAGQTVTFTVAASKPVTVSGGTPSLALSDGGTATYDPTASTSTSLAFSYTVAAGQNAADLAITGQALNGATIADSAGNTADLAAATGNPAGTLQIDTTAPTITSVSAQGNTGTGQTITIAIATSEPVTVNGGAPSLVFSNGGTATYDAADSTSGSLIFTYTVAAGQDATTLTFTGDSLNGATVTDGAGNALDLNGLINDTVVPQGNASTLAMAVASPATADLGAGQAVTFTVATSAPVTVSGGTPTLTLSDGGIATYNAARSGPRSLVFAYTVAAGQNSPDLTVTAANLNGATIADSGGNAANLATAIGNPAGTLQIDTTAPTVTGVTANPASGTLGIGQTLTFLVATSEPVSVTGGTPSLTLSDGATATYNAAASTSTSLAFTDTVAPGDTASSVGITADALNGATIADGAGNALNLNAVVGTTPVPVTIDGAAPVVTSVGASPSPGSISTGQTVTLTVDTSEPVRVSGGTPSLALNNGGTATYDPAASTASSLVFTYTVPSGAPVPGKDVGDLKINAVSLNGATVVDATGNAVDFSAAVGTPATPNNFAVTNTTTNFNFSTSGDGYTGPVQGLQHQYINVSTQNLNITALVPNSFIHTGSGQDAIDVSSVGGTNVLDGSTGSNFLVGGGGSDTFFVDDRVATADIWSTVVHFHTGDAATIYGVTASAFNFDWEDNQGAAGYTGLTLHATAPGKPTASITLTGYSSPDLSNGRLTVSFGNDPASQSNYMYIHAN